MIIKFLSDTIRLTDKRGRYEMTRALLLKNMELEKEFRDINLDGVGELVKEMMLDLYWDLFIACYQDKEDYIVASSNEYAETVLKNRDKLIEALKKSETEFIKDMHEHGIEINEYAIKDNSMEYLANSLEFFEEMIG